MLRKCFRYKTEYIAVFFNKGSTIIEPVVSMHLYKLRILTSTCWLIFASRLDPFHLHSVAMTFKLVNYKLIWWRRTSFQFGLNIDNTGIVGWISISHTEICIANLVITNPRYSKIYDTFWGLIRLNLTNSNVSPECCPPSRYPFSFRIVLMNSIFLSFHPKQGKNSH